MDKSEPVLPAHDGEMLGSMLVGLVHSLKNVQVISGEKAAYLVKDIESTGWYPMSIFCAVLDEAWKHDIDFAPILFQAGFKFVEDWYLSNGGKSVISSAVDYLRLQAKNVGYSTTHRGDPDKIGWQDLVELDEPAGRATVVCVTPYPMEFERGIMYSGTLMAGDVQFADIESIEEPYNRYLSKKTHHIRFKKNPDKATNDALDAFLSSMSPAAPVTLPAHLHEAIAWRLKGAEEQYRNDRLYYEQSGLLLSKAAGNIYEISRKLERFAHQDELTNLLNRRAVFEKTKIILALAARHSWPVAFIMIDIDHFKPINDTWGHAAGDDTLRHLATIFKSRLRDSDLIGRVGGEEFLIVLPQADLEATCTLAENLRIAVEQHTQFCTDNQRISVTISLGVSIVNGPKVEDMDHYIMQADRALYRAKRNGRNQVAVFQ